MFEVEFVLVPEYPLLILAFVLLMAATPLKRIPPALLELITLPLLFVFKGVDFSGGNIWSPVPFEVILGK